MRTALLVTTGVVCLAATSTAPAALYIEGPTQAREGDRLAFAAGNDPRPEGMVTYEWDFGDGSEPLSGPYQSAVSHRFGQDGEYTVTVRSSGEGGGGTAVLDVVVEPVEPSVEVLSHEEPVQPGTPLAFQARATDPGDDTLTYVWDFGDGSPPTEGVDLTEPTHTYAEAGNYVVTLTVRDEDGLEAVRTLEVAPNEGFLGQIAGEVPRMRFSGESGKASLMNILPGSRAMPLGSIQDLFTGAAPMGGGVADLSGPFGICLVNAGFWDDESKAHINFQLTIPSDSLYRPRLYTVGWEHGENGLAPDQLLVNALVLGIDPSYEDTKDGAENMELVPGGGGLGAITRILGGALGGLLGGGGGAQASSMGPGRNWQLSSFAGFLEVTRVTPERIHGDLTAYLRGAWLEASGSGGATYVEVEGSFAWELDEVARANLLRCGSREFRIETHTPSVEAENEPRMDAQISVTFTVPYDRESVTDRTFQVGVLEGGAFRPLPGRLVHDRDGRTVHFEPEEELQPLAYHHVRLTGGESGIRSQSEEAMPESYEWRFFAEPELTNSGAGAQPPAPAPEPEPAAGPLLPAVSGPWAPEEPRLFPLPVGATERATLPSRQTPPDPCDRDAMKTSSPIPTVDVVVYQAVCDPDLIPAKTGLVRVYVGWDPVGNVVAAPSFPAKVTITAGSQALKSEEAVEIVNAAAATAEDRRFMRHSINVSWVEPGGPAKVVSARVVPDRPIKLSGPEGQPKGEVGEFPGSSDPFTFMDRKPVLEYVLVFPKVGVWKDGVPLTDRVAFEHRFGEATEFARAVLPVSDVRMTGTIEVDIEEPGEVRDGECDVGGRDTPCRVYDVALGTQEAKTFIADAVMEALPRVTYAVVVIPPGHYHPFLPGVTRKVGASVRTASSVAGLPFFPRSSSSIGAYAPYHTLAHEMAHYLGLDNRTHTPPQRATSLRHEGVEGFLLWSQGAENKSTLEGNTEASALWSLMAYPETEDPHRREEKFILREHYLTLYRNVTTNALGSSRPPETPDQDPPDRSEPESDVDLQPEASGGFAEHVLAPYVPDGVGGPAVIPASSPDRSATPPQTASWRVGGYLGAGGAAIDEVAPAPAGHSLELDEGGGPAGWAVAALDASGREIGAAPVAHIRSYPEISSPTARFEALVPVEAEPHRFELRGPDGQPRAERVRSATTPTVSWSTPPGATWAAGALFHWKGSDPDGDPLRFTLLYSPGGEGPWLPLATPSSADTYTAGSGPLAPGPRPTLRVVADDGFQRATADLTLQVEAEPEPWAVLPAPDAEDASLSGITASFTVDLDAEEGVASALTLLGPDGAVPGAGHYDAASRRLHFEPTDVLRPGTRYTATLAAGLTDRWGNRLSEPYVWSFTTAPDTIPPGVVVVRPRPGGLSIPVGASIRIRFTEAMDRASLEEGGLSLLDVDGGAVAGSIEVDDATGEVVFTPTDPLRPSTAYSVVVGPPARDPAGNPLAGEARSSFTTAGAAGPGGSPG